MSGVATDTPKMTAAEFAVFRHERDYELVDGKLVERSGGFQSALIATELNVELHRYGEDNELGYGLSGSCGFKLRSSGGDTVRKPDGAFVCFGRFPNDGLPRIWANLAPDLAAEVVSPDELAEVLHYKLRQWRENGVRLVWVIWPRDRTVDVYRANGSHATLTIDDELDGEDVLPGFRLPIARLFERPRPSGSRRVPE